MPLLTWDDWEIEDTSYKDRRLDRIVDEDGPLTPAGQSYTSQNLTAQQARQHEAVSYIQELTEPWFGNREH